MSRSLFLVGAGGLIGSIARYITASYFNKVFPSSFPYGTFIVNFTGCLAVGIIYGLAERFTWFNPEWRLFLAVGVCGGYTTFSAFAYENIKLLQQGNYYGFAIYSIISFSCGLIAVLVGLIVTKI